MRKLSLLFVLGLFLQLRSFANNLVLGTPTISGSDITFTIKWDNSWLVTTGPSNWDAVWIFIKRQTCNQATLNPWVHGTLAATGHTVSGSQLQVDLASDNMGVFIRRAAAGIGNITQATVTLKLASAIGSDNIGVYGIEMVNVPEGQFYIGDGEPNAGQNGWSFTDGNSTNPKLITQAIQQSGIGAVGNYSRANIGSSGSLGASFPLGYNRFYCMKYEITTSQYVSFLNTLTYNQQLRLSPNANGLPPEAPAGTVINRTYQGYIIEVKTPGNGTTTLTPAVYGNDATDDNNYDQPNDGLGYPVSLGNKQFLSYLDWAALRPMTDFEYEKACRGPLSPQVNEYAWGTTDYTPYYNYSVTDKYAATEKLSGSGLGMGNIQSNNNYRVGIAATATSNRVNAGATYYGIMEMTGGMHERVVGRHGVDYSGFTSDNGDGILDANGFSGWNESIMGGRGGSWREYTGSQISNRYFIVGGIAGGNDNGDYWGHHGGRGVRSF